MNISNNIKLHFSDFLLLLLWSIYLGCPFPGQWDWAWCSFFIEVTILYRSSIKHLNESHKPFQNTEKRQRRCNKMHFAENKLYLLVGPLIIISICIFNFCNVLCCMIALIVFVVVLPLIYADLTNKYCNTKIYINCSTDV